MDIAKKYALICHKIKQAAEIIRRVGDCWHTTGATIAGVDYGSDSSIRRNNGVDTSHPNHSITC